MKILHLVPTLSAGGAETFVVDLAVAQRTLGHDTDLFLLGGVRGARGDALRAKLTFASIGCFGASMRSARDLRNVCRLLRLMVTKKYDVVHAHLFSVEVLLASLIPFIALFRKKPLLIRTLHNANIYGTRSRLIARMLAGVFDWNFACGKKVLQNYVQLFGEERSSVIENGVSALILTESNSIRTSLGLPADAFVVACIGAFRGTALASSQKGQDTAIRAFNAAFGNDPRAHLLLVGDGELRPEAERLSTALGAENVHFLGNLPSSHPVLFDSDLLFISSRYEGLPIVGLEASCTGIPVLASKIDELVEVGGPYGWIFPESNTVDAFREMLLDVKENLPAYKCAAVNRVDAFTRHYGIRRCAEEYVTELKNLLALTLRQP